jgi:hypothetical protein
LSCLHSAGVSDDEVEVVDVGAVCCGERDAACVTKRLAAAAVVSKCVRDCVVDETRWTAWGCDALRVMAVHAPPPTD